MTRARDIANLVDANGDIVAGALDNVPASNDASALTTGTLAAARLPTTGVDASSLSAGTLAAARLPSSGISASAVDTGTLPLGQMPAGTVVNFKTAVTQNASSTSITGSTAPGQQYGANRGGRTYSLAQTITITPQSTSNILYCVGTTGWTSATAHTSGAHGTIITFNDSSSIDNSDYPWYSETYFTSSSPYWPSDVVVGYFEPNTTSQVTLRLRPYVYREQGTKTMNYQSASLIVMEIAQ